MSVGGQSNAPQTPFSPNYRERRSVQPRGPGNAYTQRPGQQPNPQQPAQLQPAPQPNQPNQPPPAGEPTASTMALVPATKDGVRGHYTDGSMRNFVPDTPTGGGREYTPPPQFSSGPIAPSFDSGYGNPFGSGFGGGYSSPFGGGFGGGYSTPFSDYGGGFGGGFGQPPQYSGGYGGGYGGGYSSPYMSPSMMGGLASLFGGMQGGGFQGMFNPQSQAQAQMRAYQQNQQRNFNQPPPGMVKNPNYDASYAMQDNVDAPGTPGYMKRQQFIPSSLTEIQPQFGGVNRQDEGENSFKKLMATLPSEERAKYHGTSEHRNSADTLEQIRRTRQHPEWGRYYQNKSDDEIYAGMQQRPS